MVTILKAERHHMPEIELLYKELFQVMAQYQPNYFRVANQSEEFIEQMIVGKDSTGFVAIDGATVVGFTLMQKQSTPPYACFVPHQYGYIFDIVVNQQSRGKGVGKALIQAAKDWASQERLDYLELSVLFENTGAEKLYQSLEFETSMKTMRCAV